MSIIAIDPGGRSGVALFDTGTYKIRGIQLGPQAHHGQLFDLLFMEQPSIIVCEKFSWRSSYADLTAVEYIGVVKLYVANDPRAAYFEQLPATGKGFWTDDKLKKLSLYFPGAQHATDAVRHLLHYLTFECGDQRWVKRLSGQS